MVFGFCARFIGVVVWGLSLRQFCSTAGQVTSEWLDRDLLISTRDEEVFLTINQSKVCVASKGQPRHAIRGGQEIVQLIFGSELPNEVAEINNMKLEGDADQLIEVLFPLQYPQMRNQDL